MNSHTNQAHQKWQDDELYEQNRKGHLDKVVITILIVPELIKHLSKESEAKANDELMKTMAQHQENTESETLENIQSLHEKLITLQMGLEDEVIENTEGPGKEKDKKEKDKKEKEENLSHTGGGGGSMSIIQMLKASIAALVHGLRREGNIDDSSPYCAYTHGHAEGFGNNSSFKNSPDFGKAAEHMKVLGLEAATLDLKSLKAAYRKCARDCHPDKNIGDPNATEKFQRVNEANEFLQKELENQNGAFKKHVDREHAKYDKTPESTHDNKEPSAAPEPEPRRQQSPEPEPSRQQSPKPKPSNSSRSEHREGHSTGEQTNDPSRPYKGHADYKEARGHMETLGLTPEAIASDPRCIGQAFRKEGMKHHPDKHLSFYPTTQSKAAEKFGEAREASTWLKDNLKYEQANDGSPEFSKEGWMNRYMTDVQKAMNPTNSATASASADASTAPSPAGTTAPSPSPT